MGISFSRDGRKYTLCLLALVIASVAMFTKFAPFIEWSYFTLGVLAIYAGANVAQKATEKQVSGKKA